MTDGVVLPIVEGVKFKWVNNQPYYCVGDDGSIFRWLRSRKRWRKNNGWVGKNGYKCVALGHKEKRYVHHLVLETFIGPRPPGMECCHGDGNRTNARLDNLRWDTLHNNRMDMRIHGTDNRGERRPVHVLTEPKVVEIRRLRAEGRTLQSLADQFDVHLVTVFDAVHRKTWKHIP